MIGWLAHHFVHPFLAGIGLFLAASLVLWHYASRVFPEWATGARRRWVPPTLEPVLRLASLRRWAVLSLLWLAVARPYWTDALSNGPMALFLIDFSRSAEGLQIPIDDYVGRRLRHDLGAGGRFAMVGFAESPELIQPWSGLGDVNLLRPVPWDAFTGRRDYTDIEQAVRFALTLLPTRSGSGEGRLSLVVLTDGNENYGSLMQSAASLRRSGVNLEVVTLPVEKGREIALDRLIVPESLRVGEPLSATLTVQNYNPTFTEARVHVQREGRSVIANVGVGLYPGQNTLRFPLRSPFDRPGSYVFEAEIQPTVPGTDRIAENNRAGAVLRLEDKPHLYVVEPEVGAARGLAQTAWEESSSRMRQTTASTLPTSVGQLMDYDGIVLYDMHTRKLPPAAQQALSDYVREFGGGLIVTGGPDSFEFGQYQNSTLEEILPVRSREPRDRPGPTGLLIMLIDFSGSMGGVLDLVKLSANQTIDTLPNGVTMDVLAFDARPQAQLEAVVLDTTSRPHIKETINRLKTGGGTDLWPALDKGLQRARAFLEKGRRRDLWARILVFSDGKFDFDPQSFGQLIDSYRDYKIQINCMAIGRPWEPNPLREVARLGHGRFEQYEDRSRTTPFFSFEDPTSPGERRAFAPTRVAEDPILVGLPSGQALPITFSQYNHTSLKADAHLSCFFHGPGGAVDPLLAWWHAGLGRVVTFASEAGGLWSESLTASPIYRKIFLQTLIFTRRSGRSNYCRIDVVTDVVDPGVVRLRVRTDESELGPLHARIFFPERPGNAEQNRLLPLQPVKPGVFEAAWSVRQDLSNPEGGYAVAVRKQTPAGDQLFADGKIYLSPMLTQRELSHGPPNRSLLARFAKEAGGVLLEINHTARPFPPTFLAERRELLDTPARYLFGLLVLGLLFWDIAGRTRSSDAGE